LFPREQLVKSSVRVFAYILQQQYYSADIKGIIRTQKKDYCSHCFLTAIPSWYQHLLFYSRL